MMSKSRLSKSKWLALLLALCLCCGTLAMLPPAGSVSAATKRTVISEKIVTDTGKLNRADWQVAGNEDKFEITDNGKVMVFNSADYPGVRLVPDQKIAAGKGFSMQMDVLKTAPATILNLAGFTDNLDQVAACNFFISSLGIVEMGAGTEGDKTPREPQTGEALPEGSNFFFASGYRYRFTFRINAEEATKADLLLARAPLATYGTEPVLQDEMMFLKIVSVSDGEHLAQPSIMGGATVDNLKITDSDGSVILDTDFTDETKMHSDLTAVEGGYFMPAGYSKIANDTYLTANEPAAEDRLVTYLPVKADEKLDTAFVLTANVRLPGTAGKAGFAFGLKSADTPLTDADCSFIYLEQGVGETLVNAVRGGAEGTAASLGADCGADFVKLKIEGDRNGTIRVYAADTLAATFTGQSVPGLVALVTDGSPGAKIDVQPDVSIVTYSYQAGAGADLSNNFNTGYVNAEHYTVDGHNATTLGNAGKGIALKDGILKFDGTSDGTHFALNGTYADFILQFDWINYGWDSRPTKEDGTVFNQPKPASGYGTELYSPLGIAFGKKDPVDGWASGKLLRVFDGLNLIQFIDSGVSTNEPMGKSFSSPEDCADIREGKINLYQNTVNFKIAAVNNVLQVYGVVMENGKPQGDHKMLAEFPYENAYGYLSLSTSEAGYFGIDNLRITKLDGMDGIPEDYENFIDIPDEQAPQAVAAPVLKADGKTVSWNAVEHATGYIVTVNGIDGVTQQGTTYTLNTNKTGSYTITVRALGDGVKYENSAASNEVTIEIAEQASASPSSEPTAHTGCSCGTITPGGFLGGGLALIALALVVSKLLLYRKKRVC